MGVASALLAWNRMDNLLARMPFEKVGKVLVVSSSCFSCQRYLRVLNVWIALSASCLSCFVVHMHWWVLNVNWFLGCQARNSIDSDFQIHQSGCGHVRIWLQTNIVKVLMSVLFEKEMWGTTDVKDVLSKDCACEQGNQCFFCKEVEGIWSMYWRNGFMCFS